MQFERAAIISPRLPLVAVQDLGETLVRNDESAIHIGNSLNHHTSNICACRSCEHAVEQHGSSLGGAVVKALI